MSFRLLFGELNFAQFFGGVLESRLEHAELLLVEVALLLRLSQLGIELPVGRIEFADAALKFLRLSRGGLRYRVGLRLICREGALVLTARQEDGDWQGDEQTDQPRRKQPRRGGSARVCGESFESVREGHLREIPVYFHVQAAGWYRRTRIRSRATPRTATATIGTAPVPGELGYLASGNS